MENEVLADPPLVTEENLRFSLHNAQNKMERVNERAIEVAKKRDLEGISHNLNSFDALSDPELILRAVKMGINIPDTDFANVDILRELENCRNMGKNVDNVEKVSYAYYTILCGVVNIRKRVLHILYII